MEPQIKSGGVGVIVSTNVISLPTGTTEESNVASIQVIQIPNIDDVLNGTEEEYPKTCDLCKVIFYNDAKFSQHKTNGNCLRLQKLRANKSNAYAKRREYKILYPRRCERCLRLFNDRFIFASHKINCRPAHSNDVPFLDAKDGVDFEAEEESPAADIGDIDSKFIIAIDVDSTNEKRVKSLYPRICIACHRIFRSETTYTKHKANGECQVARARNETDNFFNCTTCYGIYKDEETLRVHSERCNGSRSFPKKCPRCDHVSEDGYADVEHRLKCKQKLAGGRIRRNVGSNVVVVGNEEDDEEMHRYTTYPRVCEKCQRVLHNKQNFYNHKKRCPGVPEGSAEYAAIVGKNKLYPRACEKCCRTYNNKQGFYKHKKNCEAYCAELVKCNRCGVAYNPKVIANHWERCCREMTSQLDEISIVDSIDELVAEEVHDSTFSDAEEEEEEEEEEEASKKSAAYPRKCEDCDKEYQNRQTYYKHRKRGCKGKKRQVPPPGPSEKVCDGCGETLASEHFEDHVIKCWSTKLKMESIFGDIMKPVVKIVNSRKCEKCDNFFFNETMYEEHLKGCNGGAGPSVAAKETGEGLPNVKAIVKFTYMGKCEKCEKWFGNEDMYKTHVNSCTGSVEAFTCKECEKCAKLFDDQETYNTHLETCGIGEPIENVSAFMEKLLQHTNSRKCDKCQKVFEKGCEYEQHVKHCDSNFRIFITRIAAASPPLKSEEVREAEAAADADLANVPVDEEMPESPGSAPPEEVEVHSDDGEEEERPEPENDFLREVKRFRALNERTRCEKCETWYENEALFEAHLKECGAEDAPSAADQLRCVKCRLALPTQQALEEHCKKMKCACCYKYFCNEPMYKKHVMKFMCVMCKSFVCNEQALGTHTLQKKCAECDRVFCSETVYRDHLMRKCGNCTTSFCKEGGGAFEEHAKICKKIIIRLKCKKCGKLFLSGQKLCEHNKVCVAASGGDNLRAKIKYPRKCTRCNQYYSSRQTFSKHVRRTCDRYKEGVLSRVSKLGIFGRSWQTCRKITYPRKCVYCPKMFSSKQAYSRHLRKGDCLVKSIISEEHNFSLKPESDVAVPDSAPPAARHAPTPKRTTYPKTCKDCHKVCTYRQEYYLHKKVCQGPLFPAAAAAATTTTTTATVVSSATEIVDGFFQQCTGCEGYFKTREIYDMHKIRCTFATIPSTSAAVEAECDQCYTISQLYDDHKRTCPNFERQRMCTSCGRFVDGSADAMDVHRKECVANCGQSSVPMEVDPYPRICEYCLRTYNDKQSFETHKYRCHIYRTNLGNISYPKFCECCQRLYKTKQAFYNHKRQCHFYCLKYFLEKKCDYCNKPFRCEKVFLKHREECSEKAVAVAFESGVEKVSIVC